jgi:hypothetical protein
MDKAQKNCLKQKHTDWMKINVGLQSFVGFTWELLLVGRQLDEVS